MEQSFVSPKCFNLLPYWKGGNWDKQSGFLHVDYFQVRWKQGISWLDVLKSYLWITFHHNWISKTHINFSKECTLCFIYDHLIKVCVWLKCSFFIRFQLKIMFWGVCVKSKYQLNRDKGFLAGFMIQIRWMIQFDFLKKLGFTPFHQI